MEGNEEGMGTEEEIRTEDGSEVMGRERRRDE
jgi:hypothetical protein